MAETPNLGLYITDINQASDAGMSVFKLLELLLGSGYVDKSNMEKIDEAISVIKNKLADYKSENVYITDHQKEGIENKQSEFNWTKNNQVEYIAKLLGGYEKGILTVENTNITSDKSDILFTVTQGFSKLNNVATSGISEIQLAKSLLCERIMLDIKNDNDSIVYLTVYITVNGVQTTIPMTVPAKASVQKSFYNSIVRDLDDNSTIKFQAQTDGLPLIINSGSKAQYDYIDIDKISNLGDNFSDIIDNVYNELRSDIDSNVVEIGNISSKATKLETNLTNPNLLINSNFAYGSVVNQRGKTEYTNANSYTIDMWGVSNLVNTGVKLVLESKCIRLESTSLGNGAYSNFYQPIEDTTNIKNKTITTTIDLEASNGSHYEFFAEGLPLIRYTGDGIRRKMTFSYVYTGTNSSLIHVRLLRNINNNIGDYIKIYSIKAELGGVATQFVDDDPATKLAKCQRYLTKIPRLEHMRAVQAAGNNLYFNTKTPVCMRTRPTIISATENIQYNVTKIPLEVVTGYGLGIADYTSNNLLLMCTKQGNTLMDGSLKILEDIFLTAEI